MQREKRTWYIHGEERLNISSVHNTKGIVMWIGIQLKAQSRGVLQAILNNLEFFLKVTGSH